MISNETSDRAVSEVLGFVLVFSLVVATVGIVSVYGLGSLEDARDNEQINNAERAFDVLADNMADIHREGAPSRATEISLEDASLETGETVTVNLTGVNTTAGQSAVNSYSSQPIVYDGGSGTTIVYSVGAVFRVQREGGVIVEEPPIVVDSERFVFPVVQLRQTGSVTSVGDRTVRVRGEKRQRQPVNGFTEPSSRFDEIIVNVTSPRRDFWHRYLDSFAATDCVTPRQDNVRCVISDPKSVYVSRILIGYEFEL